MALTVDGVSIDYLTAQPLSYREDAAESGRTARQWQVEGLVTEATWLSLLASYDTWRAAKIQETPPETSLDQGTTVLFSGSGPGGQTWSNIAVWYASAPSGQQVGAYIALSITLVDAVQAIEIYSATAADGTGGAGGAYDYGTYTLWGVTIQLTEQPDSFSEPPSVQLTASGVHYVSGALVPVYTKNITGTVDEAGWSNLLAGYANAISNVPSAGDWYPTSAITGEVTAVVEGSPIYTVSIELVKLL